MTPSLSMNAEETPALATARWLVGPEGREALARVTGYDQASALAAASALRAEGLSAEQSAAVLTQARLRAKAPAKFGELGAGLFFTPNGYEQSTRWSVTQAHARHLVEAGVRSVIDLGCGIGADSLAFSSAGIEVFSIESDPVTALFASTNVPQAQVICADGREVDLPEADAIWLDPARRTPTGKRINDPEQWSPAFSEALALASRHRVAGIKVAPGIAHEVLPADSFVEWTSERGELLEAVVWRGTGRTGRAAVVDGVEYDSKAASADAAVDFVDSSPLGSLILEPDAAVIRSGGISRLCAENGLAPVSPGIAYLTGEAEAPLCAAFRVLKVTANNPKAIKKALAEAEIGPVEIKKRGTDTDIEGLRKKLGKREGRPGVVILTPLEGKHRAVVAERV